MNAAYQFLILMALYMTCAWLVGIEVGRWLARRDRRETTARRQILGQLFAVANTRGHKA